MYERTRKNPIQIYLSDEELDILNKKFELSRKTNRSAFIRQLILEGFVYDIDFSEISRYNFLLSNIANNINQVAHRCNETRSVFRSDIDTLRKEMDKLWQLQRSMLSNLPCEKQ